MSAPVVCRQPSHGVRTHQSGTAAAIACAAARGAAGRAASSPPAPPAPAGAAGLAASETLSASELARCAPAMKATGSRKVADALRVWCNARESADGWSRYSGDPHPGGGYLGYRISADVPTKGQTTLAYLGPNATTHRTDGPATVVYSAAGQVVGATWERLSSCRRVDGPAAVERGQAPKFRIDSGPSLFLEGGRHATAARFVALGEEHGLDGETALGWLRFEALAGTGAGDGPIVAGVGWQAALELAEAGVGADDVAAVSEGSLPISWATAGA